MLYPEDNPPQTRTLPGYDERYRKIVLRPTHRSVRQSQSQQLAPQSQSQQVDMSAVMHSIMSCVQTAMSQIAGVPPLQRGRSSGSQEANITFFDVPPRAEAHSGGGLMVQTDAPRLRQEQPPALAQPAAAAGGPSSASGAPPSVGTAAEAAPVANEATTGGGDAPCTGAARLKEIEAEHKHILEEVVIMKFL